MGKSCRIGTVVVLLAMAPMTAGCGGADSDDDAQAEVDRELDLAMADDTSADLADVGDRESADRATEEAPREAARPPRTTPPPQTSPSQADATPTQQRPRPAPAGPHYEEATMATGTSFRVSLNQELSTRENQVGDLFTTTLLAPVTDGVRVLVPAGAAFRGEVTAVQASGGSGQQAVLKIAITELSFDGQTYPVSVTVTEANPTTKGRDSTGEKVAKIGAGAVVGGILGRVIGGNATGTIVGGVVGAAAGTAIALGTEDVDAVLAEGSEMTLQLDAPLTVRWEV
jgi:hypothetical protein